jgi:hypothetical protein
MLSPELFGRFARSPTLVSGRLHVVNLDRLEQHFGASWPRVKARALAIAEQTILGGLGPQDLHIKVEEAKWLFFFPSLDKEAAQMRCAMLADKVFRRLIGDDTRFDEVRVETVVVEADGKLLLEAADPAALAQSLMEQAAAPADPKPAQAQNWYEYGDDDEPEPPRVAESKGPPPQLQWLRREPETFPADINFHFVPTWDASRDVVATHSCEPVREAPGGVLLTGYDTLTRGNDSSLVGVLDVAIFKRARAAVRELIRANDPGIIVFTVHCRTLEMAESRRHLTDLLERTKPEERKLFAAKLAGLPAGAPTHRILQGVSFLKRYARAVFVRAPLNDPNFDDLRGSGAYGVVCRPKFGATLSAKDIELLGRFGEQARRAGLKPVATGLRSHAALVAAIGAGIVNVNGEAVGPPVGQPHGVRHFSIAGIHIARAAGAA